MEIARTDNHFSLYTLQSLPTHMSDKFSFDPKICFHLFSRFDFLFWKRFNKGTFWGKAIWEGGRGSKTFSISTIGLRFNDGNRLRDFLNSSGASDLVSPSQHPGISVRNLSNFLCSTVLEAKGASKCELVPNAPDVKLNFSSAIQSVHNHVKLLRLSP